MQNLIQINTQRSILIIRNILGCFLMVSGLGKLIESSAVIHAALQYAFQDIQEFLPENPQTLLIVVSIFECIIGTFFLANTALTFAVLTTGALLLAYTMPLALAVFKDPTIPTCGYLGIFDFGLPLSFALIRNIALYCLLFWMQCERQFGTKPKHLPQKV